MVELNLSISILFIVGTTTVATTQKKKQLAFSNEIEFNFHEMEVITVQNNDQLLLHATTRFKQLGVFVHCVLYPRLWLARTV